MAKIILVGYMASGKSTVAERLHAILGFELIDFDRYIEERSGMTIAEIFREKGEIFFRKLEHEYLKKILEEPSDAILSLGGGTPCYAGNHLLLRGHDRKSFYLQASVGELAKRLRSADNTARPLIADIADDDLEEFIAKHLFDRNQYYRASTHIIMTDGKSPEEIAREIAALA